MVVWFGDIGHLSSAKEGVDFLHMVITTCHPGCGREEEDCSLIFYSLLVWGIIYVVLAELEDVSSLLCEALTNISTTCPAHIREGFRLIFEFW